MTAAGTLVVSEVFGATWQGEGPSTGRVASFIRTGGCNLHCTWCDTPWTWDASRFDLREQMGRRDVPGILADVADHRSTVAVITGGEPLLHQAQPGWAALLDGLTAMPREVEVETNGTVPPAPVTWDGVARFNVSVKLAHAGDPEAARIRPDVIAGFAASRKAVFKFVAQTPGDLDEVDALVAAHGIDPATVWVMPEGTDADTVLTRARALADPVLARRWNMTTRLHVLLWGDERGR